MKISKLVYKQFDLISKHKISNDFCDRLKISGLTCIYLLATISFSEKADFSLALCQELLSLSYPNKYKNTVKCSAHCVNID